MYSLGLAGRHRFNDYLEFKSSFLLNLEEEDLRNHPDPADDQDVTFTHETTLSLIPSDLLRFDLNLGRRCADETTRSIVKDVLANNFVFLVDVTPDYATSFSGQAVYSRSSDGNNGFWDQIEAAKRFTVNPYFWLGARYTGFEFEEVVGNGY
jgi:hypothetical protein